jgi:hypothetical protein
MTTKKTNQQSNSNLFNICKATLSKNGNYVNLTLIKGTENNVEFANVLLKINNKTNTYNCKTKDNVCYIAIPLKEINKPDTEDKLFD